MECINQRLFKTRDYILYNLNFTVMENSKQGEPPPKEEAKSQG